VRFALLIALSHLRSNQKEMGVSAITAISMFGVTIGVAALIIVLSVMAGFEIDLRDKILGSNAHVVVLRYGSGIEDHAAATKTVSEVEGVTGVAPFIYTEMMIKSEHGNGEGVILKGIDPAQVGNVVDLKANIVMGPDGAPTDDAARQSVLDHLGQPQRAFLQDEDDDTELPGILLGEELAHSLKVFVGDRVHIINPIGRGTGPLGMPMPDVKAFRVAGIYYSGMYEYDTKWTYITIEDAQLPAHRAGAGVPVLHAPLDEPEPQPLRRAEAREGGDGPHPQPHRERRLAEHRGHDDPGRPDQGP
jgi:lipoprotein-releasing system permease protein